MKNYFLKTSKVKINPLNKIQLGGFEGRQSEFDEIDSDLEINCIYLYSSDSRILMITLDTLFCNDLLNSLLKKELLQYGIREKEFFLCGSHTHYAPILDSSKKKIGKINEEYFIFVFKKLKRVLRDLFLKQSELCFLYTRNIELAHGVNRRKKIFRSMKKIPFIKKYTYMLPNNKAYINNFSNFILIKNISEEVISIIWNYTCHPVSYPKKNNITSHFPGEIRNALRKKYNNENLVIGFLQGWAGDTRPKSFEKLNNLFSLYRFVKNQGRSFADFTEKEYIIWINDMKNRILKNIDLSHERVNLELGIQMIKMPISEIFEERYPSQKKLEMRIIKINSGLILLGVSGEVTAEYENLIRKKLGYKQIIFFGYMNESFGYIPTKKMLKEGGYEAEGFLNLFDIEGNFKKNLEETLVFNLQKLNEKFENEREEGNNEN